MNYLLTCDDCLGWLGERPGLSSGEKLYHTIFADPPDNIGLKYSEHDDNVPPHIYAKMIHKWVDMFVSMADTVWFSFNARHILPVASAVQDILCIRDMEAKLCVQTFTFGQHNHHDLGNNFRPLWRLRRKDSPLFPDAVRVESERQKAGDKRADPRGRVPSDVFDFPRVVGNSKQRRRWHPTQLHEGLVERCLRLTTPPGGNVCDPFGGTGTTLRVAQRCGFACDIIELDIVYCENIALDCGLEKDYTFNCAPPRWIGDYAAADSPENKPFPLFGGPQDLEVRR